MPKYLSPLAYRFAYDGLVEPATSTTLYPDALLASLIARSEAAIDAYVGMPLLTNNGFAPGVLGFVQQGFDMVGGFGARKLRIPTPLVPVRNIKRIQIHISNASPSGEPLLAILEPGEVIINNWDGYCECIALTLTYSLSAVVWELGANPPLAEWDLECGFYLPYLGDTLYDTGNGLTFRALRGFWASTYTQAPSAQPLTLPPVPPVIYLNGVVQASGFSINYAEGSVTFTTSQSGQTVTADYTATIPEVIREAAIDQVTYLLQQRALNQAGMGGLEQARSADFFARRSRNDDTEEDQLCAKARLKLAGYKTIAIG